MVIILKKTLEKKGADDVTASRANLGPVSLFFLTSLSSFSNRVMYGGDYVKGRQLVSPRPAAFTTFSRVKSNPPSSGSRERFTTDSQDVTSVEQCRRLWLWMEDNRVTDNCIIITAFTAGFNPASLQTTTCSFSKMSQKPSEKFPTTYALFSGAFMTKLLITFTKTYFQEVFQTG